MGNGCTTSRATRGRETSSRFRIGRDGRPIGAATRLTAGLGAQSIALSGDGRRIAYAAYVGTSNIWSLPFPPNGETQANAVPVTSGSQTIESRPALGRRHLALLSIRCQWQLRIVPDAAAPESRSS
jgi:hypothetical protein